MLRVAIGSVWHGGVSGILGYVVEWTKELLSVGYVYVVALVVMLASAW